MQLIKLAIKVIRGTSFRSFAIFSAVAGVAGFMLAMMLIISGTQQSLDSNIKRLGADIVVVPKGTESTVGMSLLMAKPVFNKVWMPRDNLNKIAAVPGVEAASPQVYLASMYNSPCCSVSEMFVVVFDPETDFTIKPWLEKNLHRDLRKNECIGGTYIFVPDGWEKLKIYGYDMDLVGNLEPTGTGIDKTLFMSLETAKEMGKASLTKAVQPAYATKNASSVYEFAFEKNISSVLVKIAPGADIKEVSQGILNSTSGISPVESPRLFDAFRSQMTGLLWGLLAITFIVWIAAMALIGVVFSMVANERRREMAVLRAIGATRNFILRSMLTEAILLALGGALTGILVASAGLYIFKDMISVSLKMPFLFPAFNIFIVMVISGVALAIFSVALSVLMPAVRLSRRELAISMRE